MILMRMVAEGGEKVRVESISDGRVRVLIDDGPAGTTSFIVPAFQVVTFGSVLVSACPASVDLPTLERAAADRAASRIGRRQR